MNKDFDKWNRLKKNINNLNKHIFFHSREIWWCSLGLNIGSEEDGKNELFERPVLIIKVFSKDMSLIIPLTTKLKEDKNHIILSYNGRFGTAILSQIKTISNKRFSRKLCKVDKVQFNKVVSSILGNIV